MPLPRLAFCSLLLGCPLLSLAQATDLPLTHRFYGGLGAYSSMYNVLGGHYGDGTTVPIQGTLGYQLRPRLALQVSFAYSGYSGAYTGSRLDFSSGLTYPYSSEYRNRFSTISLLGRYSLTRQAAHHIQFDLLGGFTREHYSYDGQGAYFYTPDPSQPAVAISYDDHSSNSVYLLTVGPGVRYRFGQRLELAYNWLVNLDLQAPEHPNSSAALGLRYRFGRP